MNEPLDFCRVKKIDEKGFGFLKSLYYPGDVFFHFSRITQEEFSQKLHAMKRGQFFLFFTSKIQQNNKRKVDKIWYSIDTVPGELITQFIRRIIDEFNSGATNIYDLLFVFEESKKFNIITSEEIEEIIASKRILNLPTTIVPFLNEEERTILKKKLNLEEIEKSASLPFWYSEISQI